MTRINVYTYASDDDYSSETALAGWFNDDAATRYDEQTRWDGNNSVSVNPVGPYGHQALYRTKSNRWVLNTWSQYQGVQERYEFVDDDDAKNWLTLNEEDAAVVQHFGELEEESGPSKGGRPRVGEPLSVAYPTDLTKRIDAAADRSGLSRAAWLRQIAAAAVSVSEQRAEAGV